MIDIIRPQADQEYLDRIAKQCFNSGAGFEHFDSENDPKLSLQKSRSNAKASKENKSTGITKKIVFLDRNNTPDIWGDI